MGKSYFLESVNLAIKIKEYEEKLKEREKCKLSTNSISTQF